MLCVDGYLAVRRRYERILSLVKLSRGFGRCYPGLESVAAVDDLRARFHLDWSEKQCAEFVLRLITDAGDNWRTHVFDRYFYLFFCVFKNSYQIFFFYDSNVCLIFVFFCFSYQRVLNNIY